MAKYYGNIGYGITRETAPDVYKVIIEEHPHYGDILKNTTRWQSSQYLNDSQTISNEISIVADAFAYDNFQNIRYAVWMNKKWKVISTNVDPDRPRINLTLGGIWNGQETT